MLSFNRNVKFLLPSLIVSIVILVILQLKLAAPSLQAPKAQPWHQNSFRGPHLLRITLCLSSRSNSSRFHSKS